MNDDIPPALREPPRRPLTRAERWALWYIGVVALAGVVAVLVSFAMGW